MQQEDAENPTASKEARRPYASASACLLSVGPEETVVSHADEANVNLRCWPDTKLGIVQTGSTYRFVGADGEDGQIVVTSGTLDHPLANGLVTKCSIVNPDIRHYATGGKIYVDNTHNQWILLYHSEQKDHIRNYTYARLGLAKSVDNGITWSNLGEIISPNSPYDESATDVFRDVGDGTFAIIKVEETDYMYVYFSDPQAITGADGQPLINYLAVARAPLSDVLNNAVNGTVPTFYKYYNGDWTMQTGLGGQSSEINKTNFPVRYADISYNTAIQRYIMIGFSSYSVANIIESSDGLTWENGQQVYGGLPNDNVSNVYHSVVGLDGNQEQSGDAFYLYYVRKETETIRNREIFSLQRRKISCSLPCP